MTMGDLKKIFSGPKIPDPPKPPKPMEDEAAVPGVTPDDLRKKLATRLSATGQAVLLVAWAIAYTGAVFAVRRLAR